ncbi:MAG: pyridoxamine 5'-phosphate oxidase family protein [Lachnospiraceae bacterium]|nr:pyridoxamine 5'-phosphate oxidase family protein [Lachnospiraceae bacterium]
MEFRQMRRNRQQLTEEDCISILEKNSSGVLAALGDGDYPYAVPLSYVYDDGALYFHCAKSGHKLDAIKKYPKVSFCIVDQDQVIPEEYTTYFRSVIVFGQAKILEDDKEIREAIERLAQKYAPDDTKENRDLFIEKEYSLLCMVKIEVDHMTGKEAIELVKNRK